MRLIVQRVLEAGVKVKGEWVSKIGPGLLILLGITHTDTYPMSIVMSNKLLKMRLWRNKEDKVWDMNVMQKEYEVLIISQFTLYGEMNGNKPDFHHAMEGEEALKMYEGFVEEVRKGYKGEKVQTGAFGEYMHVHQVIDGPVTIQLDAPPPQDPTLVKMQKKLDKQLKYKERVGTGKKKNKVDTEEKKEIEEDLHLVEEKKEVIGQEK